MTFLEPGEADAMLAAPDLAWWEGRRDRALIALAMQTGLRLSELTGLRCGDVALGTGAHVRCTGKGRKQRCVPLTAATAAIVRVWLRERGGLRDDPLFPTRTATLVGAVGADSVHFSILQRSLPQSACRPRGSA